MKPEELLKYCDDMQGKSATVTAGEVHHLYLNVVRKTLPKGDTVRLTERAGPKGRICNVKGQRGAYQVVAIFPLEEVRRFALGLITPFAELIVAGRLEPVSAPVRRQYHKGWAMAPGSVYVAPGSILDNPFTHPDPQVAVDAYRDLASNGTQIFEIVPGELEIKNTRHPALNWGWPDVLRENMGTLRGRDFYVDCAPDVPSHVDFLIELANGPVLNVETEDAGGIR